jgi:hypothetical protein
MVVILVVMMASSIRLEVVRHVVVMIPSIVEENRVPIIVACERYSYDTNS